MTVRNLFILNTIAAAGFGLAMVLLPEITLGLYGIETSQTTIYMARFFGSALLGLGLVTWFTKNVTDSGALRGIMAGILPGELIGLILAVLSIMAGVMNALGWSVVVIYLFFSLAYVYFLFLKKPEA